ncbi:MAG: hypothetical protein LUF82_04175 [Clostridia bacterium]|nr:hypothetical protein [Clostridia bacterium]
MDSACSLYSETLPLDKGNYKVLFYRNAGGACRKEDATEVIIHFHNVSGVLVHCEYKKLA